MTDLLIHRSAPSCSYTVLCNEIFDAGLSLEALGLLAYLHHKAETGLFDPKEARLALGVGRDKYCRIIRELLGSGWVVRQQVCDPATQALSGAEYILCNSPGKRGDMSVSVSNWAWGVHCVQGTTKLVLMALAGSADDDGDCWQRVDTNARKATASRATVKRFNFPWEGWTYEGL